MLRLGTLTLLTLVSLSSFAGNFDYLPSSSGAQKEFQSLLEGGNFRQALLAWESSQNGTAFAQSTNGLGTWSYLLYQNGMPFSALQTLFNSTQPTKMDPRLVKLWSAEFKKSAYIQKGWIATVGGWKNIVNNESVTIAISKKADVTRAFARVARLTTDNVNERARILWQIATHAPLIGEIDSALNALKLLRESTQTVIGQDLLSMTQGRVLYQKGDFDGALNAYLKIPKSSSIWVESVEERSWTHLRQENYDKAMGDIATALSPALTELAGPETYFLADLISYKVCDYPRVFNTSEAFKTSHRARLASIQDLATKGTNTKLTQVFERFDINGVSQESAGPLVDSLPRGIYRDQQFIRTMESRRALLNESKLASNLFEDTKTLGQSASLERLVTENKAQAERLKQLAYQRTRLLAQGDVKEYRMVLNKMHIIEAEVIERLHMDDNLKGERSRLSKNEDSSDVLVFPYTSKEVWMDELDNYKARVKDCPTLKGASL